MNTFLKVAERFGVPTAFCAIVCFAIWRTGNWTATEVLKPVIHEHIEYLKGEVADRKEMKTALIKQTDILKDIRDDQRKFPAVAESAK